MNRRPSRRRRFTWRSQTLTAVILLAGLGVGVSGGFAEVRQVVSAVAHSVSLGSYSRPAAVAVYVQSPTSTLHTEPNQPGAPKVSTVTVVVYTGTGSGRGTGGGENKGNGSSAFSIRRVTLHRNGVIDVKLTVHAIGRFRGHAAFAAIFIRRGKPRHARGNYGSGSATVLQRGSLTLTITPTKSTVKALAGAKHLAIKLTITFRPAAPGGHTSTASATITVR